MRSGIVVGWRGSHAIVRFENGVEVLASTRRSYIGIGARVVVVKTRVGWVAL